MYYFLEQARDHYEPVKSGDTTVYGDANASVLSVNTVNTMNTTRTPPTPSLLSTLDEKQLLSRRRLKLIEERVKSQSADATLTKLTS